jgi:hypothetical protein
MIMLSVSVGDVASPHVLLPCAAAWLRRTWLSPRLLGACNLLARIASAFLSLFVLCIGYGLGRRWPRRPRLVSGRTLCVYVCVCVCVCVCVTVTALHSWLFASLA